MKWLMAVLVSVLCAGMLGQRAQAQNGAASVAGKWHFVLDTEGGDRDYDANFVQDGNKVTGKFGKDNVQGTFDDGQLKLEFPVNSEEAGPGTLKITGALASDALTGNWEFQQYSGTYKAKRTQ